MNSLIKRRIRKIVKDTFEEKEDIIAIEKRLRISVNGKEVLSLYCTPLMVRELIVGLFLSEDIIKGNWCAERMSIEYGDDIFVDIPAEGQINTEGAVITSGCIGGMTIPIRVGLKRIEDPFEIRSQDLKDIFKRFQDISELYKITGCIHSAALSDGKNIICHAEDIGRHNAVDKVIGYAILENLPFSGKILLASGRLSSEMVSKCSKWGIPIVASRTSPTSLALDIAEKSGITVVGFIRADRMNVYTNPQRII